MRRADRLFRLVQLLRARRFATGERIASELGVSKRTIYRDIADLQGSGVPIKGEAGVGYALERGYELAPLIFTSDELAGLVLGARIVAAWGDPQLAAAVATAMTKVEAVLPEGLRRLVLETPLFAPGRPWAAAIAGDVALLRRAISERRYVHFRYGREDGTETPLFAPGRPWASAMAGEVALLRRAISERRLVHFKYGREDGLASERDARPLGLYFWGRKWTLAAWCELRRDYRSFRPDRMKGLELLDQCFDPDADSISLAGFLENGDPADWESWEWRREASAEPEAEPTATT